MSAIVDTLQDVLTLVRGITYDWGNLSIAQSRPSNLFQLVAVWNDQVSREQSGTGYTFGKPACFVEMETGMDAQMLLDNTSVADTIFRFHIVDRQDDAADGTMDQNLQVFSFRDKLKAAIAGYQPVNCSTLFYVEEKQDFQHTNVYHFTIDAKCAFMDTPVENGTIWKDPPTNLELITGFEELDGPIESPLISYIWKVCMIQAVIVETPNPLAVQTLGNGTVIPLEYALNPDGTLTIDYLTSTAGITVLTPFLVDNGVVENMAYDMMSGTFDPTTTIGSFAIDNVIEFNASLPMGVD